jgi:ABC-type spermidine/putrescine transport system permease subunit I
MLAIAHLAVNDQITSAMNIQLALCLALVYLHIYMMIMPSFGSFSVPGSALTKIDII